MKKILILLITTFLFTLINCDINDSPEKSQIFAGQLISQQKVRDLTVDEIKNCLLSKNFSSLTSNINPQKPISIWEITFYTNNGFDSLIEASAIICIPSEIGKYPLLTLHQGTIYEDSYTPSQRVTDIETQTKSIGLAVAALTASSGYVSLAPDLIGFGASVNNPQYMLVKKLNATNTADMIVACKELLETENYQVSEQLFVMGYSQGGYTALAVNNYLKESNYNLKPTAVVAAAFPSILSEFTNACLDTLKSPDAFLTYFLYSHCYYNNLDLNNIYRKDAQNIFDSLFDGLHSEQQIINSLSKLTNNEIYTKEIIEDYTNNTGLGKTLGETIDNCTPSEWDWSNTTQMRLYCGNKDELVPQIVIQTFKETIENNGANVSLTFIPNKSHISAFEPIMIEAFNWFNELKN